MIVRIKKRTSGVNVAQLRLVPKKKVPAGEVVSQSVPQPKKILRDQPPEVSFLQFESIAGRGGMAVVWRAWHKELSQWVAVKVLDEHFASKSEDVRQFMSEVTTMTNLCHPGIVRGYGADCVNGRWFFIMDFVAGYTFGSLLHRKSRLPEQDACIICESIADAMGYAWRTFQIVHCDIKPENIMVDRDGTVKITDLGLCQTTNAIRADETASDEVAGTPAYISPEQVYGDVALDCRADIYSLGATLYHLTTGRMLFPGLCNEDVLRAHVEAAYQAPDIRTIVPTLSCGFARLLAKMLVKDRDAGRYATWESVIEDVRRVELGESLAPLPADAISSMKLDA